MKQVHPQEVERPSTVLLSLNSAQELHIPAHVESEKEENVCQ